MLQRKSIHFCGDKFGIPLKLLYLCSMSKVIKLIKLNDLPNAEVPFNIPEGYVTEGINISDPVVGDHFYVGNILTSPVTEIIDNQTFKTCNSLYRIVEKGQIQKPRPFQLGSGTNQLT